ncbi:MAG: RidA family protein [Flavobacteriaceae bacterium]|jgi:2-iminobutanoate/2-iminopropanoate deaminase|nr:RidA family protein [Flavobacteriaceae bacterium]
MKKTIVTTDKAPAPLGPYNQAVLANDTLYLSGQIPLIPGTMELVEGDLEEETKQVMQNLKAVLEAAEMSFENVVKTSIFLSDMNNFTAVNKVYGRYFDDATAPARETVEVANLPKFVRIEISMVAVR